jgi:hypothetical protein
MERNILSWVLTLAGLLLAVLYSPIGSPDLYKQKKYFIENQGVNFRGGIKNAPKGKNNYQNDELKLSVPDYSSERKNTASSYPVKNTAASYGQSTGYVAMQANDPFMPNRSSNGSNGNEGATFSVGHKSSRNNTVFQDNGITTLNTDSKLFADNNTTRQSTHTYLPNDGGTDPGGDPTNPPIPVPDGFGFLLLLAIGYAVRKINLRNFLLN